MILFLFHTRFGYLADSNTNSLLKLLLFSLPPGTQQMQMQALGHSHAPPLDCVLAFVSPGYSHWDCEQCRCSVSEDFSASPNVAVHWLGKLGYILST